MPISIAALKAMVAAGATADMIVAAIEAQQQVDEIAGLDLEPLARSSPTPSKAPVCVYLISSVRDGAVCAPIKIGISTNPGARIDQLRTASAHPLDLTFTFNVQRFDRARAVERQAHETIARFRLNGEWFDVPPPHALILLSTIVSLMCCAGLQGEERLQAEAAAGCVAAEEFCRHHWPEIFEGGACP